MSAAENYSHVTYNLLTVDECTCASLVTLLSPLRSRQTTQPARLCTHEAGQDCVELVKEQGEPDGICRGFRSSPLPFRRGSHANALNEIDNGREL